jgi:methyl-accepting chemotaxis protein
MVPARNRQDDESYGLNDAQATILRAETLRHGADNRHAKLFKGEEKISLFWRLFGGTLLSIAALVCITIYQQFNSAIGEMRTNINRLTESRADLLSQNDFNTRVASLWTNLKDVQSATSTLSAVKEHSSLLDQQVKALQDQLNSRLQTMSASIKELDAPLAAAAALKERSALLEQQVKTGDDERKDLTKELQQLRERLAVLEGRQAATATPARTGKDAAK